MSISDETRRSPQDKLKEIEERLSGQQARCIAGSFKLIQEARHDFALNGPNDIHWLISRVKQLEAALERVADMCNVGPKCECGRPNGLPAVIMCTKINLTTMPSEEK